MITFVSLPNRLRRLSGGNYSGLRWGRQLLALFDRLQNNAVRQLGLLGGELLHLNTELLYTAPNAGEIKGHGLKLLHQFAVTTAATPRPSSP